jgi:hypothetical protein
MPDPSAPSDLEKRSTETTASKPLKFTVLRLALAFVIAGVSDVVGAFVSLAADRMGGRCRDRRAVGFKREPLLRRLGRIQRPQLQRGGGGGWFGNGMFEPFQRRAPQPRWDRRQTLPPVRQDSSKAPAPEKRETVPQRHMPCIRSRQSGWTSRSLFFRCTALTLPVRW